MCAKYNCNQQFYQRPKKIRYSNVKEPPPLQHTQVLIMALIPQILEVANFRIAL